jgi:hypothetical protein
MVMVNEEGSDERLLNPKPANSAQRTRKSDASISSSSYLIQVANPTRHHGVYAILLLFDR